MEEFTEMLRTRLPSSSSALHQIYSRQLLQAQQLIRRRRLEQWRCGSVVKVELVQGTLKNCYFMCSVGNFSSKKWGKVITSNFYIWRYGQTMKNLNTLMMQVCCWTFMALQGNFAICGSLIIALHGLRRGQPAKFFFLPHFAKKLGAKKRATSPCSLSLPPKILPGAFSAMRYHYQAAVINLAKDAVVPSAVAEGKRPTSIEDRWCSKKMTCYVMNLDTSADT